MGDTDELKHAQLAALGRGVGALRLALGDGLMRLGLGFQSLGFPTLESYSREALQRSGRWASESRLVARRLMALPSLREALVCGHLSWSMTELLVRVATPDDEAEWVARAAELDVRGLRTLLKMRRVAAGEEREPRVCITMRVDRVDAWAFERARLMVEAVGAARGDEAIEALLAEGLSTLLAREPDLDLPSGIGGDAIEMRTSDDIATRSPRIDVNPIASDAAAPEAIDVMLRALATELARRDLELGRLARTIEEAGTWRERGHASFDDYCREHIGLSPSSVVTRMVLARRLVMLPTIGEALDCGRIGYEAAALIARVASTTNAHAWIERAEDRTVKHLREEVDAVEMLARANGEAVTRFGPPSRDRLADVQAVERQVIATVTGQDSQMSGDDGHLSHQMSADVTLRFTVGESVGQFWRALERLHRQVVGQVSAESFVAFLVRATIASWRDSQPTNVAYADVYLRDRWRCASPVCSSRNVTPITSSSGLTAAAKTGPTWSASASVVTWNWSTAMLCG